MSYSLAERVAIITGANQGLGLAIAKAYAQAGAHLYLCARNAELLTKARAEVAALARPTQRILAQPCDVSNPNDIKLFTQSALAEFQQIHILVNNAGIYGPMGLIEENEWDEWTQAFAINVYGSVLMCRALLPHFRANGYGKILQISGGGATAPLPRLSAYAASKAAIVRFAETLAEETREAHIDVNAIAPGALNTQMTTELLEAGPEKVGAEFHARMMKVKESGGTPVEVGGRLAVFLGSAASDGITGKLISAPWDPWEELPHHREELTRSDIYTIRRIVPKDRGHTWGERP